MIRVPVRSLAENLEGVLKLVTNDGNHPVRVKARFDEHAQVTILRGPRGMDRHAAFHFPGQIWNLDDVDERARLLYCLDETVKRLRSDAAVRHGPLHVRIARPHAHEQ